MSKKAVKVVLSSAPKGKALLEYLHKQMMERLGSAASLVDRHCMKYECDVPWKREMCEESKFWLHRVAIGAVGRIKTVDDAVWLGLVSGVAAKSRHFACMALYYIFRLARTMMREERYLRDIEEWFDTFLGPRAGMSESSRFVNYDDVRIEDGEK